MRTSRAAFRLVCLVALNAQLARPAVAQSAAAADSTRPHHAVLAGRVRDPFGHPLTFAVVSARDQGVATMVDDSGVFRIAGLLPDASRFTATRVGYAAATFVLNLPADSTVYLDIHLQPTGPLDVVTTTGTYSTVRLDATGFGDRRRNLIGYFIGPDQIARKPRPYVAEYLIGIPGVSVHPLPAGAGYDVTFVLDRPCQPTVFVDGVLSHAAVDDAVSAADIFALEVYPAAATAPDRFASADREHGCGVVALWTRRYAP